MQGFGDSFKELASPAEAVPVFCVLAPAKNHSDQQLARAYRIHKPDIFASA